MSEHRFGGTFATIRIMNSFDIGGFIDTSLNSSSILLLLFL